MRHLARWTIPLTTALALVGPNTPALAAPEGAKGNVTTFQLVCDDELSTLTVGGGPWSAAHVAGSDETFIPVSTYLSMRDAETLELLYEEHDSKGRPRGGPARCVEESVVDGVLVTFAVHGHLR